FPFHNYDLSVVKDGFTPEKRSVSLRSNVPVNLEVALRLEDHVVSIDVSASGSSVLIDPESTGTHTELNQGSIGRLPTAPAARGLEGVLLSMPGFAANANGAIHPRGAHNQMTFVVDGMPISDQLTGAFANAVDPSVVESVELYTGNVPAEFGNKVSGVAVVTTQSGLNSGRKFAGSLALSAAQFGTLATLAQAAGGTGKFGYFASLNTMKSNRYLDQVSNDNLHNGGNSERAFTRLDYQATPVDIVRLSAMAGRSSFQLANLRSQHAHLQDQRQELNDISISTSWLRTLGARATVETNASFRNAFAELYSSPGDTPVTASQSRRLTTWNFGSRYSLFTGRHNVRLGVDYQRFPLREHFNFAITDARFNSPASPGFIETLLPHDLTRSGRWFSYSGAGAGQMASAFIQNQIRLGRLQLHLGLRFDNYRFLVVGSQFQPRLGVSYHVKESGTVFRASYNRTYQTPPNENLLLSSSPQAAALAPAAVRDTLGSGFALIRPERQNVYELGLQQSIGTAVSVTAAYYHKQSDDLQDNDNFLNTGIIFPTSLAKSRVNGAEGRVMFFPGRRFSASLAGTHYHVIVTPPFTGGLFLGSAALDALSAGPFVIDHDQKLGLAANAVYNVTRSLWTSLSLRCDSGLVSNPSNPDVVRLDPDYANLLPYVDLTSNPPRVNARTLTDIAVGYARMKDSTKKWEVVVQVSNLFDRTALYNFQSIFVGTRLVSPRAASLRFRWFF
ncbi:MAG TPA: TonB-dependent receptor plug domain-containing protein, partial [Bryobacteraceae bacterium]|nr:TonB-dependent receptor plug domain-containing protein [Bryobacteraceae bacterium]